MTVGLKTLFQFAGPKCYKCDEKGNKQIKTKGENHFVQILQPAFISNFPLMPTRAL